MVLRYHSPVRSQLAFAWVLQIESVRLSIVLVSCGVLLLAVLCSRTEGTTSYEVGPLPTLPSPRKA